jgi:hypothetical protein
MGVNATTFVPTYVAGEILTAADMNVTNSGIPVFATTTTRDNSFGGTGEKVLAEGQFAYIEATNTTQYYDGSAWVTVGATPGLNPCVPTSVTVGSGSATTSANGQVTFTGVSSVSLNGVFSSTYDNYRILFRPNAASTTQNIGGRLRVAGTDASGAATYNELSIYNSSGSAAAASSAAYSLWYLTQQTSTANQTYASYTFDLYGPAIASQTVGTGILNNTSTGVGLQIYINSISHTTATAYDGFSAFPSSGTMGGTISVYGYTK